MVFSKTTLLVLILALIEWAAASPVGFYKRGQNVILGYRVVIGVV